MGRDGCNVKLYKWTVNLQQNDIYCSNCSSSYSMFVLIIVQRTGKIKAFLSSTTVSPLYLALNTTYPVLFSSRMKDHLDRNTISHSKFIYFSIESESRSGPSKRGGDELVDLCQGGIFHLNIICDGHVCNEGNHHHPELKSHDNSA